MARAAVWAANGTREPRPASGVQRPFGSELNEGSGKDYIDRRLKFTGPSCSFLTRTRMANPIKTSESWTTPYEWVKLTLRVPRRAAG